MCDVPVGEVAELPVGTEVTTASGCVWVHAGDGYLWQSTIDMELSAASVAAVDGPLTTRYAILA